MLENKKRAPEPNGRLRKKSGGLRSLAWWVVRNRKEITLVKFLETLTADAYKDAASNIGHYLRGLEKAGIIKRAAERVPGKSKTSNGHVRYLLVIDCGEATPLIRVTRKEVYAPSFDKVYPMISEVQS